MHSSSRHTSRLQQPCSLLHSLLRLLFICSPLLLLDAAAAPPPTTDNSSRRSPFVTDADMGIHTYNSIVELDQHPINVRVHLRFLCSQQPSSSTQPGSGDNGSSGSIAVEGFVSTYELTMQPPAWAPARPHHVPWQTQQHLDISINSRQRKVPLAWVGPRDWGLWRVRAQLPEPEGPFQLAVAGSATVQDLPHPLCSAQQQPQLTGTPDLAGGTWNVLTTTSNSTLDPKTLAFLVMQHHTYHRSIGFSGTILRSNLHESKQLVQLPDVRAAVEQHGLLIWPWEHEHVASWSTHYWQRPKNQLTLLGAYGRGARLAYLDLDEYLVLADPHASLSEAQCFCRPLLDSSSGSSSGSSGSSGEAPEVGAGAGGAQQGVVGSWTFVRFQAKTCPHADADLPCWQAGASVTSSSDIQLLHDLCPMSTAHGKQVLLADRVDSVSVHFTASERYAGNRLVDPSCGHLLHFYSLLEGRRAGVTGTLRKIPALTWTAVDTASGVRRALRWPEGLAPLAHEQCKASPAARIAAVVAYKRQHKALHGRLP